jgi:tryptophan synthase beta chain
MRPSAPSQPRSGGPTPPPKPAPPPKLSEVPNPEGMYGAYGGATAPEDARPAITQLQQWYARAYNDAAFWDELLSHLRTFAGRATPLYSADALTAHSRRRLPKGDGARLWLKREDLAATGSGAINHALGFALLAVKAGVRKLAAPAVGGPHALAVAAAAAHFGLECQIFAPVEDGGAAALRGAALLGASIVEVESRAASLTAAWNAWRSNPGSVLLTPPAAVGMHPLPAMVRDFQCIVGREVMAQSLRQLTKLPDVVVACVGMGAEVAGVFYPFVDDATVKLVGVEAGGRSGVPGEHAAPISMGQPATLLGQTGYAIVDASGAPGPVRSVAPGLAYAFAGPEHAYWKDAGRVRYTVAGDDEALHAMSLLARTEGILASIEASHAVAEALKLAGEMKADQNIVVILWGRGDKDVELASKLDGTASRS